MPVAFEARDNGVLLTFSDKLDASAANASAHFVQCWNYRYSASYGSPELSLHEPGKPGHDVLQITSAHILANGNRLFLEIPQLVPTHQIHIVASPQPGVQRELFLTAHNLGAAFTDFLGYKAVAKTHGSHEPAPFAMPLLPVFWERGDAGRELKIQTAAGLQFAQKELRAKAGERISLTLENPDNMPHNWVLLKAGSVERVGALANALIAEPNALSRHYVPESADVLCHTRMLDPLKSTTIHFNAPAQAGQYPYICTFPGHWAVMRGVLIVE
jgi:azurin